MRQEFNLVAELRDDQGKGASRRLRRQGKVPAILYGAGRPPRTLSLDHNRVLQQLEQEAFHSSILTIQVGEKSQPAILKDVQRHPAKRQILHMDFQRILEDEKIRMTVPLHVTGEQAAPGVKQGGTVWRLITEVEVSCLPRDLPEYIAVDISNLGLDEMLYLSDLEVPSGVEIPELAHGGEEKDHAIVSIHVAKAAAEEEETAEGAAAAEGAAPEGGAPAEGGEKSES